MGYCILRFDKLKTSSALSAKYRHNYRQEEVPNADRTKQGLNRELVPLKYSNYVAAVNDRIASSPSYLARKPRRDAVRALELMLTFNGSAEAGRFNQRAWEQKNVEWIEKEFGKENVVSVMCHYDESTPHIHAMVVPMVNDRLSAKTLIGSPAKCSAMQTRYAKAMSEFGLERGLEHTRAKHEDIQKFYAALNKTLEEHLPRPERNESAAEYKERAESHFSELLMQYMSKLDKEKKQTYKLEHEARKLRATAKTASEELETAKAEIETAKAEIETAKAENARLTRELAISKKKSARMDELLDGLKHGCLPETERVQFERVMHAITAWESDRREYVERIERDTLVAEDRD